MFQDTDDRVRGRGARAGDRDRDRGGPTSIAKVKTTRKEGESRDTKLGIPWRRDKSVIISRKNILEDI